jgi:hypothetical protein
VTYLHTGVLGQGCRLLVGGWKRKRPAGGRAGLVGAFKAVQGFPLLLVLVTRSFAITTEGDCSLTISIYMYELSRVFQEKYTVCDTVHRLYW